MDCLFYRLPTSIHKGHRFEKDDPLRIDPSCAIEGFETSGGDENVVNFGESVHYPKSDIVAGPFIENSRIP
jgi:hypothetical protein